MNSTEESGSVPSVVEADVVSQNPSSNSQLVDEVFSLVKGYLTSQLEEKGKRSERISKSDKEAADIKFKGNRKQFELNLQLDNILTRIDESASSPADVHKLVEEGKLLIKKRQKLIKIADKNKDGWLVQEYESDDLASDSEDEKKIRKAKAAAEKRRKETKSISGNTSKKFKSSSDYQLFRIKTSTCFYFVKFWVLLVGLPEHPTINLLYLFIYSFKRKIIYVRLSVAN